MRGDICVVGNCSVHMKGDNGVLQDPLLHKLGVPMVPLPPYWYELNPTELVFQTLLARLRSDRVRYNSKSNTEFYDSIIKEMMQCSYDDAIALYLRYGYKYF